MSTLYHFLICRRDIPLGDVCAQLAHAAGESFYKFAYSGSSARERSRSNGGEVGGVIPSQSSNLIAGSSDVEHGVESRDATSQVAPRANISQTVAVVLGARNEYRLAKLSAVLEQNGIDHVAIRETEGPLAGQLTAIGLVPVDEERREFVRMFLHEFHLLRALDDPARMMVHQ